MCSQDAERLWMVPSGLSARHLIELLLIGVEMQVNRNSINPESIR